MAWLWKVPLAIVGLTLVRGAVYPQGWGHRGLAHLVLFLAGAAMVYPLTRQGPAGLIVAGSMALVFLLPYRTILLAWLVGMTKKGLRRLARKWGTELREDPATGLFQVVRESPPKIRVWNVLTHLRSIHPGVSRTQDYMMLAFIVDLPSAPPFQCAITKSWPRAKYFEKEWRESIVMQGDLVALSMDSIVEDPRARATGGRFEELQPYTHLSEPRFASLAASGTNPEEFSRVFSGDVLDGFFAAAFRTMQFEFNVTPTTVNIFKVYCGAEAQEKDVAFLEMFVARLYKSA